MAQAGNDRHGLLHCYRDHINVLGVADPPMRRHGVGTDNDVEDASSRQRRADGAGREEIGGAGAQVVGTGSRIARGYGGLRWSIMVSAWNERGQERWGEGGDLEALRRAP